MFGIICLSLISKIMQIFHFNNHDLLIYSFIYQIIHLFIYLFFNVHFFPDSKNWQFIFIFTSCLYIMIFFFVCLFSFHITRYTECNPTSRAYLKYAKWEEKQFQFGLARGTEFFFSLFIDLLYHQNYLHFIRNIFRVFYVALCRR